MLSTEIFTGAFRRLPVNDERCARSSEMARESFRKTRWTQLAGDWWPPSWLLDSAMIVVWKTWKHGSGSLLDHAKSTKVSSNLTPILDVKPTLDSLEKQTTLNKLAE